MLKYPTGMWNPVIYVTETQCVTETNGRLRKSEKSLRELVELSGEDCFLQLCLVC